MKNLIVLFLALVSFQFAAAQDDAGKLAKKASKALQSYNLDPTGNAGKLDEARTAIEEAVKDATVAASAGPWQTLGDIYNTITLRDLTAKTLKADAKMTVANPAYDAYRGFSKAYELGQKKFEKKDALKGLTEAHGQMVNLGVGNFQGGDFETAFNSFDAALKTNKLLSENGEKSNLEKPDDLNNVKYLAALAAQNSKRPKVAEELYEELYKAKYAEAAIYEGLAKMRFDAGKAAEGEAILAEGRKAFPDDSGLLFTEINYYLKAGKLDQLTNQLKTAISKEPGNVGLYVTLGQVYDNLYGKALESKDDAKAAEYLAEATKAYTSALEKDDKNVDALYSLGALSYNKAAGLTKELNALPDDNKAETQRKYDALRAQIMGTFDAALPFFKRAEAIDPNDRNTLIALREIFAKKDELEISLEFKKRLEKLDGGGKNEKPYFQN